jgi:hypothetical protein
MAPAARRGGDDPPYLTRYVRSFSFERKDSTFNPSFVISIPLTKPRTVCACQPVSSTISGSVAPWEATLDLDRLLKLKRRQRERVEARASELIAEGERQADADRRAALEELAAYDEELGI